MFVSLTDSFLSFPFLMLLLSIFNPSVLHLYFFHSYRLVILFFFFLPLFSLLTSPLPWPAEVVTMLTSGRSDEPSGASGASSEIRGL